MIASALPDQHWLADIWQNEGRGLALGMLIGPYVLVGMFALVHWMAGQ
jgi:hypothetical protein